MIDRAKRFLKEVRVELGNVTRPKKEQLWGSTGVVIVISLLLALFIGVVDLVLARVIGLLLR